MAYKKQLVPRPSQIQIPAPYQTLNLKPIPMDLQTSNPAAYVVARMLRIKHPQPDEPQEYNSPAEALTVLRSVSGMKREEMAFRLGLSVPQFDKSEAGSYGGTLSMETLEKCRGLAGVCNLPIMANFFRLLHVHARQHKKHGPKKQAGADWWREGLDQYE